jgi:non-specific serine/threonine protein kinase
MARDLLEQPSDEGLDAMSARVRALHGAAWLASDQHDFEQARLLFQQSADLRHALGWDEGETNLLLNAARQARAEGRYGRALTLLEDALSRHRASGNRGSSGNAGTGLALYELALALREQGNFARACRAIPREPGVPRAIGDSEGTMSAVLGLGDVARDQGDPVGNRKYSEPSLTFFRGLGHKVGSRLRAEQHRSGGLYRR